MSRPFVLLTNDDGVQAAGLYALVSALRESCDLAVVAPEHNWSASGHAKTMHKPLRVTEVRLADGSSALATNGSPSDCVAMCLLGLLDRRPDLVISGINLGANVGHDLTYSGTVSAAMEAIIGEVSAIAISVDSYTPVPFEPAAEFCRELARHVLQVPLEEPLLLNVNVPALPRDAIRGVQITRLGRRIYRDKLIRRTDPRGRSYYWIGGDPPQGIPEEGTDIGALHRGLISVTPVALDLTDEARLSLLRSWDLGF